MTSGSRPLMNHGKQKQVTRDRVALHQQPMDAGDINGPRLPWPSGTWRIEYPEEFPVTVRRIGDQAARDTA